MGVGSFGVVPLVTFFTVAIVLPPLILYVGRYECGGIFVLAIFGVWLPFWLVLAAPAARAGFYFLVL